MNCVLGGGRYLRVYPDGDIASPRWGDSVCPKEVWFSLVSGLGGLWAISSSGVKLTFKVEDKGLFKFFFFLGGAPTVIIWVGFQGNLGKAYFCKELLRLIRENRCFDKNHYIE